MHTELTITRVLNASRERVWHAWTDEKELAKWWGPRGVTTPICEWDARPEGAINITMLAGPELGGLAGQKWPMIGTVKEVVPMERLVFTGSPTVDGNLILENLCTVVFEESDGKTKMTLHIIVTKTTPQAEGPLQGMEAGWTQSIDKLEELLNK
jgi:uncharacterized protein YndB with AHSA1/START domain